MKKSHNYANVISIIVLFLLGAVFLYPFIWMISTSLKTQQEALVNTVSLLPKTGLHWDTYVNVWGKLDFFKYFFNSVQATLGVILGVILIYSLAGFAIAKLNFYWKDKIFIFFISLMFVPGVTVTIPLYILVNKLGLADSYLGLILPIINGGGPFAVLLFTGYFRTIPTELVECSIIDGAGYLKIYLAIFMPLAMPVIATVCILNFLGSWNALLWPMIVLTTREKFTLPMGLMYLDSSSFRKWNELMAGAVYSVIPVITAFLGFQKYYIQGLTLGSIKA